MDEQSLIRHYLPAIAAFFGFLLMALFFPFAEPADKLGEKFDLKVDVAGAQSIPAGDGLAATYFSHWQCSETTLRRTDATIDFPPTQANGNDQTSFWQSSLGQIFYDPCIKWRGQLYIEGGTGDYIFYIAHDDHVTLRINGTQLYQESNWKLTAVATSPVKLDEKRRYDIEIDFFDSGHNGYITLEYSGQGISRQIIPQRVLYSGRTQCSDKIDNENDGKTDFGSDPGCQSAHDDIEGDEKQCEDLKDNDIDNRIDHPQDPGCSSKTDDSEGDEEACRNNKDDDGDGAMDHPNDKGCSSPTDTNESDEPQCNNGKDDDSDGRTDLSDPGCNNNPNDSSEGDEPLCKDGKDNDSDGKIDTADPGCTNADDNSEGNPQCSDGLDNDHDSKIDMADRGCETEKDDDEKNPPVDRNILLKKSATSKLIIQDRLEQDDLLKFTTDCKDCKIELSKDPKDFLGGSPAAKENFTIIAKLVAPDNKISTTIVAVGNYFEQKRLFTKKEKEYTGIGEDPENQYLPGVVQGEEPNFAYKIKIGNAFEVLPITSQLLPAVNGSAPHNGSIQWYLFSAKDSEDTEQLFLGKFRHWDLSAITDTKVTAQHLINILSAKGDFAKCSAGFLNYPQFETLLQTPAKFQEFLELLSLCQRK